LAGARRAGARVAGLDGARGAAAVAAVRVAVVADLGDDDLTIAAGARRRVDRPVAAARERSPEHERRDAAERAPATYIQSPPPAPGEPRQAEQRAEDPAARGGGLAGHLAAAAAGRGGARSSVGVYAAVEA